jgi:hypothetical protein
VSATTNSQPVRVVNRNPVHVSHETHDDGPVFVEPHRPRLKPGIREMFCQGASVEKKFGRLVDKLTFTDPLSADSVNLYLNASAGTGTKFYAAWVLANGGQRPKPRQRMSVRVFKGKFFEVEIGETRQTYDLKKLKIGEGYSVVKKIVRRTQ